MNKANKNNNWPITTNRFVGYIDIMGFKEMVARRSHEEIYTTMKRIVERIKLNVDINWSENAKGSIKITTYSDSIIIYSKDASTVCLDAFVCTMSSLANDLLIECVPHKGAMAFGKMTLDEGNSIFFGQPLIDAYLLQDELLFYGIVAHSTIEKVCRDNPDDVVFISTYLCPFKGGQAVHQTVYPMDLAIDLDKRKYTAKIIRLKKAIDRMRFSTSGALRRYIDNTESYVTAMEKNEKSTI